MKTLLGVSLVVSVFAVVMAASMLAPEADFEGGSGYAAMFAILFSFVAFVMALVVNLSHVRGRLSICALVVSLTPVALVYAISKSNQSSLRSDLSATIVYEGQHEEIILEYTHIYGSVGGRKTRKGEVVVVDSVRDDGRIVLAWGPTSSDQQSADLNVTNSVPEGGGSVVISITLTDEEATFNVIQP